MTSSGELKHKNTVQLVDEFYALNNEICDYFKRLQSKLAKSYYLINANKI